MYEYARCSKCNYILALKSTNRLYGANKEFCGIHEIEAPFEIDSDIFINFLLIEKEIFNNYTEFFVPEDYNCIILPIELWNDYISNKLDKEYNYEKERFDIVDRKTRTLVPQINMFNLKPADSYDENMFFKNVEAFIERQRLLGSPYYVYDFHLNPVVQEVFNSPVSAGSFICELKNDDGLNIVFYIFKSLFSLAKSDKLNLEVRFDRFNTTTFMASFIPIKKKNPLDYNPNNYKYEEKIHVMYLNIAR